MTPPNVADAFDSFPPLTALIAAGILGGIATVLYSIIRGSFSRRSWLLIPLGLIAAVINGLIDSVPRNGGIVLNGLLAGIAGVTIIGQFIEAREGDNLRVEAIIEQGRSIKDKENIKHALDRVIRTLEQSQVQPSQTMRETKEILISLIDELTSE